MDLEYDEKQAEMPMTNISLSDCQVFCDSLNNLSGISFAIPTEAEWEFAARGGNTPDGTLYAGSDKLKEVAWYKDNSNAKPHVCDASNSGKLCNSLNLFVPIASGKEAATHENVIFVEKWLMKM